MPESSMKKIEPVVTMSVATLLIAASIAPVPLQNLYAGDNGGNGAKKSLQYT